MEAQVLGRVCWAAMREHRSEAPAPAYRRPLPNPSQHWAARVNSPGGEKAGKEALAGERHLPAGKERLRQQDPGVKEIKAYFF